jgi:TRAP-type C4-dicarboxylate transport system permease small subunit
MIAGAGRWAAIFNLNHPAHTVHWHFFFMSVSNVIVIVLMLMVFAVAILAPFPGRHQRTESQ